MFQCQILLTGEKSIIGFYATGEIVSGVVNYEITEKSTFNKIIIQLHGKGKLKIRAKSLQKSKDNFYYNFETFEDIEEISLLSSKGITQEPGKYSLPFSFTIPKNIPPSFAYLKRKGLHRVKCRIKHQIKVEFASFGTIINSFKKFKKEIYIVAGVRPRVSPLPLIYGAQKSVIQLFNFKKKLITIKVNIQKSILLPGNKIIFDYEVTNDSNVNIITVRVKLMEVYTLKMDRKRNLTVVVKTSDLVVRSPRIRRRSSYKQSLEIELPRTASSVDFTNFLVLRDYFVYISVVLPCPRRNILLKIPVLVDARKDETITKMQNDVFIKHFIQVLNDYDRMTRKTCCLC
ncbi:uncharacterized protein LOC114354004 [Ostrinia furnacalis]|uniref:uncharacterized protein LOC114354004 n=1 Tax=Ostrinia furnacalis TaxID=93504 RepID=UPI001039C1EA|nr:uncharacterized protein LOC114354004 [Ostrinia furnacalis]